MSPAAPASGASAGSVAPVLFHLRYLLLPLGFSLAFAIAVHVLAPAPEVLHEFHGRAIWHHALLPLRDNATEIAWATGSEYARLRQTLTYDMHRTFADNVTSDLHEFRRGASGMRAHPLLREPFATTSNTAYLGQALSFAALGRDARLAHVSGLRTWSVLAALTASASASFHLSGSAIGSWQHHADRLAMFALLVFTAAHALDGACGARRRHAAHPSAGARAAAAAQAAIGDLSLVALALTAPFNMLTARAAATEPLLACGLITAAADLYSVLQLTRWDAPYTLELSLCLLLLMLGAGFINVVYARQLKQLTGLDAQLGDDERVRKQQLADLAHGAWHHLSAYALALLARVPAEALAASSSCLSHERHVSHGYVRAALVLVGGGAVGLGGLAGADAPPWAWLLAQLCWLLSMCALVWKHAAGAAPRGPGEQAAQSGSADAAVELQAAERG